MSRKWTPLGGCESNPGVWDVGGAIVYVRQADDGLIARHYAPYTGGRGRTFYTAGDAVGDDGGAWPPGGVREHRRACDAARERRARKRDR